MDRKPLVNKSLKSDILQAVDNLPPMPQIMHRAREIMEDPASSLKDLSKLIETDQALAIKVLRIANSAYYHQIKKVTSIQDAVVVLGIRGLGELITIACASSLLGSSLKGYDLPAKSLWRHSIGVAFGSKVIAKKRYPALANDAFSAGLIHDAGKLILDKYIYERKEVFREFMSDGQQTFLSAEKEVLGFEHAEIAAKVCEKWNFPKSISVAIRYHHHPSKLRGNKMAYIVNVSDQITTWTGMDIDGITLEISDNSMEILGIQVNEIELIMDEISGYVNQVVDEMEGEASSPAEAGYPVTP